MDYTNQWLTFFGLKRKYTVEELKSAYRKAAKKYHPDVNQGNSSYEKIFKEMTVAYEALLKQTSITIEPKTGQFVGERSVKDVMKIYRYQSFSPKVTNFITVPGDFLKKGGVVICGSPNSTSELRIWCKENTKSGAKAHVNGYEFSIILDPREETELRQ